jgi:putative methyltransferase (TIGR04325 family)
VAINNSNKLHLIDFGGSLGTSYYQNRSFLQQLDSIRWYIVEQPHFVECGKKEFETDVLKFSNSIEEILAIEKPACLLASGVVQCLEDPFSWIQKVLDFDFEYIILDRTCFIEGIKRLTIEVVPSSVYPASFPCWFLNEAELLSLFANSYELIADFESVDGETVTKDNKRIYWKGFLWKKKR